MGDEINVKPTGSKPLCETSQNDNSRSVSNLTCHKVWASSQPGFPQIASLVPLSYRVPGRDRARDSLVFDFCACQGAALYVNRSFYSYSLTTLISLIVISVTIAVVFSVVFVNQQVIAATNARLLVAHKTTIALLTDRQGILKEGVIGLARDPDLRNLLLGATSDNLKSLLTRHNTFSDNADILVVTGNGDVVARTGSLVALNVVDPQIVFSDGIVSPLIINDMPYQIAFTPIEIARESVWLGIAMPMNRAFLSRVQAIVGVDVTLESAAFVGKTSTRADTGAPEKVIGLSVPLGKAPLNLQVQYTQPYKLALRDSREFAFKLAAMAFALIALTALIGSVAFSIIASRLVFRPLGGLHEAVARMRQGVYTEDLVVSGDDVISRLSKSFNQMQAGVAERESRIVHHAEYDALTGLTNRGVVADRLRVMLARAKANGSSVAAMTIDIQRFGDINGTLGTEAGDNVLKEVARRLASNTRATDLLARVGGDEFLIVVEDMEDRLAAHISEFIAETLERPIQVNEQSISLRVRVGAALFPEHSESPEGLRRLANVALVTAKETGQRVVMYETGQDEKHLRELAVLNDLKKSIADGQFSLHFQPKIEMKTRVVEQVEALVRWNHPQLGFIPPDEFIELLERNNKIHILTDWVLKTAIEQAQRWSSRGFDLRIAINISANDLLDTGLAQRIDTLLHHYTVDANRIIIEVTESAVMRDAELASRVLHTLRDIGIKIAVDDFGTGQTSLSLLKKLPLNELKIDKSFVQDLRSDSGDGIIIKSTIDLGHNMGLLVVAEGVETNYAWNLLKSYGCDSVQGYLISKPLPAVQLEAWFLRLQARQASRLDLSFVDNSAPKETKKQSNDENLLAELLGDA